MIPRKPLQTTLALALVAALGLASAACGSRAQANKKQAPAAPAAPQAVDVTTAPAIMRDLPRFVEALERLRPQAEALLDSAQRGDHTAELADLWEEMTMVRRSQPAGTKW